MHQSIRTRPDASGLRMHEIEEYVCLCTTAGVGVCAFVPPDDSARVLLHHRTIYEAGRTKPDASGRTKWTRPDACTAMKKFAPRAQVLHKSCTSPSGRVRPDAPSRTRPDDADAQSRILYVLLHHRTRPDFFASVRTRPSVRASGRVRACVRLSVRVRPDASVRPSDHPSDFPVGFWRTSRQFHT